MTSKSNKYFLTFFFIYAMHINGSQFQSFPHSLSLSLTHVSSVAFFQSTSLFLQMHNFWIKSLFLNILLLSPFTSRINITIKYRNDKLSCRLNNRIVPSIMFNWCRNADSFIRLDNNYQNVNSLSGKYVEPSNGIMHGVGWDFFVLFLMLSKILIWTEVASLS